MDNKSASALISKKIADKRVKAVAVLALISAIPIFFLFVFLFRNNDTAASVGKTKIGKTDVRHWIAAEKCYKNTIDENVALVNLIEIALEREVLKSAFSKNYTQEEIVLRSEWIDKNTKAPDILACAKTAFQKDQNGYYRWYIAPTLENPALYDRFARDSAIQKKARDTISAVKNDIDAGKKLSEEPGYKVVELPTQLVSAETLNDLEKGSVSGIVEDDANYSIYQYLSRNERNYYVGIVYSPKVSYETWFADFTKNRITIEIRDKKLRQALINGFKDTKQWVSLIK